MRDVLLIGGPADRQRYTVRDDMQRIAVYTPVRFNWQEPEAELFSATAEAEVIWYELHRWQDRWYGLLGSPVHLIIDKVLAGELDPYAIGQSIVDLVGQTAIPETIRISYTAASYKEPAHYRFEAMGVSS